MLFGQTSVNPIFHIVLEAIVSFISWNQLVSATLSKFCAIWNVEPILIGLSKEKKVTGRKFVGKEEEEEEETEREKQSKKR